MNKEKLLNKIIDNLEKCFGIFDYSLTPEESDLLVSCIKELQQENKQLKELCTKYEEELNSYKEQEEMNYLIEQEEVFNDYSFMDGNDEPTQSN